MLRSHVLAASIAAFLAMTAGCFADTIRGAVRDQSNAAISNAQVTIRIGGSEITAVTDAEGKFSLESPPSSERVLTVRAPGFAEKTVAVPAAEAGSITITLAPAGASETMTVTATRTEMPVSESPASVVEISREQLNNTAALAFDDVLRGAAGFDLYRRNSGRNSNPTTDGVALRGLGGSGSASRALVLFDGIPMGDPFGGWVNWAQLPPLSVQNVEIVRGGSSDLYGSDALGGVVSLTARNPRSNALDLDLNYGNEQTGDGSIFASSTVGKWNGLAAGEYFRTNGFVIIPEAESGTIDTPASSQHKNGLFEVERLGSQRTRFFLRGSAYDDSRHNGTPLQRNRTRLWQGVIGSDYDSTPLGLFQTRVYGSPETFHQSFTSVAANRASERISDLQRVPAYEWGFSGTWSREVRGSQTLVAGITGREEKGDSNEYNYSSTLVVTRGDAGALEHDLGGFVEDVVRLPHNTLLTGAVGFDRWWDVHAFSIAQAITAHGLAVRSILPSASQDAVNPRLALSHGLGRWLSLNASAYRSFRSPTLNELYRNFRSGNTVTEANDVLRAERLTGWEFGASAPVRRALLQGTFFWNDVYRPIVNNQLSATAALITDQRQNLGMLRARGLELQASATLTSSMKLTAGYQYVDSVVVHNSAEPALIGKWVAEVPRNEFTFQAQYANPRIVTVSFQGRAVSTAYDNDVNTLALDPYFRLDMFVSRRLDQYSDLYVAVENMLDQRYDVARTPLLSVGPPVLARVGLRLRLPGQ